MKNKIVILLSVLSAAMLTLAVVTYRQYKSSQKEVTELKAQVADLSEQVKQASVVKHISKQMEDIAYQQKDISDKRSDEAVRQSKIANEMRSRADLMRGRAEVEKRNAELSEAKAVEAYNAAREQRAIAEEKQAQAEYAKCVADTLSYKALARSLGSLSTTQYQIGNTDLAALLSYASWTYASRYRGDVFLPAIFNALSKSSQSVVSRDENNGAITKIACDGASSFITTSTYGEVQRWSYSGGAMSAKFLFNNPKCDFRDVYIDKSTGDIYALSRDGEVFVKTAKGDVLTQIEGSDFMNLYPTGGGQLMLISRNALYLCEKGTMKVAKTVPLQETVSCIGDKNGRHLLFCQNGKLYEIDDDCSLHPMSLLLNANVTAYAWSGMLGLSAIGSNNGTIYLLDDNWNMVKTLTGHRSMITQVGFRNNSLLSSCYDCTVNMWNLKMQKVEPVTLKTFSSWVRCFNSSEEGVIYTGDETGTLTRIVISPNNMANTIHDKLNRDFTSDEWNYYIGNTIPYETFKR